MKKFGGMSLIALGVVLILLGVLRVLDVLLLLFSEEQTAYGIGFVAGAVIISILFIAIGAKSIKKGKKLFQSLDSSNQELEP